MGRLDIPHLQPQALLDEVLASARGRAVGVLSASYIRSCLAT
jgi:hypothetical protein